MKKSIIVILFAAILSIPMLAKAESCPTAIVASCNVVSGGNTLCLDMVSGAGSTDEFKTGCENEAHGVYAASACTTSGLVGSCNAASNGMVLRLYAPFPSEYVAQACSQSQATVCQ